MSAPKVSACSMNLEKFAIFPSRLRCSAFSDSARLCRRAFRAFSKSRFSMSFRARSMREDGFAASAPSPWAVCMRSSASRISSSMTERRSSVIVSSPSVVKDRADSKSLSSMAVLARDRRSSMGPVSRPRFFAERRSACAREKEEDRCSRRNFSLRFQAFFAWSMAWDRSSDSRALRAFLRAASASGSSPPTPRARFARASLDSSMVVTRDS